MNVKKPILVFDKNNPDKTNNNSDDSYQFISIKCYFNSILNKKSPNYQLYKSTINNAIKDVNVITSLLYDYIKLKLIQDFNNGNFNSFNFKKRLDINHLLCNLLNCADKDTRDTNIINFLNENKFYNNIPKRNRTTEILKEVIEKILTNIKVNIQEHFINHLLKFIKIFINEYDNNQDNKNDFYTFILNMDKSKIKKSDLSDSLQQFYNNYSYIFDDIINNHFKEKNLYYTIKAKPLEYLKSMYFINKTFEDYNNNLLPNEQNKKIKLFNILPSKNKYYNNYVPFTSYTLGKLIKYNTENKETKKQDNQLVENMYNELFNFDKLHIRKNLIFSGHFETDGIGCSLQFYNLNKLNSNKKKNSNDDLKYLNEIDNPGLYRNKKIIGIDPGKYNILYMSDGYNKLRYTIKQRKHETGIYKRNNFINSLKAKNPEISKIETELSKYNSKSVYYETFKNWLIQKYKYFDELYEFYNNNTIRRLNMEIYQGKQKSEHNLIRNIKNTFGNNLILVFGDWSNEPGIKTGETTTNIEIKRKLSKEFKSYKIDEFNTSKLCCKCGHELKHYKDRNNEEVFRLLICEDCKSRDQIHYKYFDESVVNSKNISTFKNQIFTRDLNSCLNIIHLAEHIIFNKKEEINLGIYGRNKCIKLNKKKRKLSSVKEIGIEGKKKRTTNKDKKRTTNKDKKKTNDKDKMKIKNKKILTRL